MRMPNLTEKHSGYESQIDIFSFFCIFKMMIGNHTCQVFAHKTYNEHNYKHMYIV